MLSRGKHILALALGNDKSEVLNNTFQDSNKTRNTCNKTYQSSTYDDNNSTYELSDLDDNVNDPEYLPPKKKQKKAKHFINKERLSSDYDSDDISESDSTDDYTLPCKVMDPKELYIQTSHVDTKQLTSVNSAVNIFGQSEGTPHSTVDHEEEVTSVFNEVCANSSDKGMVKPNTSETLDSKLKRAIEKSSNSKRLSNEKLRMTGMKYKGRKRNSDGKVEYTQDKSERLLVQSKCSKRCEKKIGGRRCLAVDGETRKMIFTNFWRMMDWKEKKVYVLSLVDRHDVARRRLSNNAEDTRRKYTYTYHLKVNNERLLVCKEMFLSTLGLNEKMVYNWLQSEDLGTSIPTNTSAIDSFMPSKARKSRFSDIRESTKEYLDSLPKVPSHYCRADSKKKYLEPVFGSIADLHLEYKRKMDELSKPSFGYQKFLDLFNEMDLRLFKPKKDLCDLCCGHEAGTVTDADFNYHIKRKDAARASKAFDKEHTTTDKNVKVLTVDLQSLLVCPKLNASAIYYKMKLSCHNYTVYDLRTHSALCYFWHECDGELSSNVFTSCIIDYLTNSDLAGIDTVIIYSDGCGYQNRNVTLSNALRKFAVDHKMTIEQKYLERGHTQMECDSVHSVIEQSVKHKTVATNKHPAIYVPQHYVDAIVSARKNPFPYEVKYVDYTFFMDFGKLGGYTSIRPGIGVGSATVTDIRLLRYMENGKIMYKTNYDGTYEYLPEPRKKGLEDGTITRLYHDKLPLKPTKYQHLQQLKTVIPQDYHSFYDGLPVSKN